MVRPMGNCSHCCYATRKRKDGSCVCARYPKWVDVNDAENHFCGEHLDEHDYKDLCDGKWSPMWGH